MEKRGVISRIYKLAAVKQIVQSVAWIQEGLVYPSVREVLAFE
jgi:hypothetical protein